MNRMLKVVLAAVFSMALLASCSDEEDGGGFTSNMNTEGKSVVQDEVPVGLFEKNELRPLVSPEEMENLAWSILLDQPTYDYLQGMPHIKSEVGENDTIGIVHSNIVNLGKGDKQHWYLISLVADTAEEHFVHAVELMRSATGDTLFYNAKKAQKHTCHGTTCNDCTFDLTPEGQIKGCQCKDGGHCNHGVSAVSEQ